MADLSRVVNVALLPEGKSVATDNMNVICIVTTEQGETEQNEPLLTSDNRYEVFAKAADVAAAFGSNSKTAEMANAVFGTKPNATDFGGALVIGYHSAEATIIPATAAKLTGAELPDFSELANVDDYKLKISVDDSEIAVAIDTTLMSEMSEVVQAINADLDADAQADIVDGHLVITSSTTGTSSTITFATAGDDGTDLAAALGLTEAAGAEIKQGKAQKTNQSETQLEAITAIKAAVNIKGACFADGIADSGVKDIAAWAQANSVLVYNVFSGTKYLEKNADTNPAWAVQMSSQTAFRCLYSKKGLNEFAASYMARLHSVNFAASNSAMTIHLKTLAVQAESYSETELNKAKEIGLDVYTTFKNVPAVLSSGANDFPDNVYNLNAFVDHVQVDVFNVLKTTGTKIPQTTKGGALLVDAAEKTCAQFVRSAVFAPGTWSSPDYFGDRETFERSIEEKGFYCMIGSFAEQSQADRQQRIAPPLQIAVKNAGAIHEASVIINFNL